MVNGIDEMGFRASIWSKVFMVAAGAPGGIKSPPKAALANSAIPTHACIAGFMTPSFISWPLPLPIPAMG
jgi:hypothetical protein